MKLHIVVLLASVISTRRVLTLGNAYSVWRVETGDRILDASVGCSIIRSERIASLANACRCGPMESFYYDSTLSCHMPSKNQELTAIGIKNRTMVSVKPSLHKLVFLSNNKPVGKDTCSRLMITSVQVMGHSKWINFNEIHFFRIQAIGNYYHLNISTSNEEKFQGNLYKSLVSCVNSSNSHKDRFIFIWKFSGIRTYNISDQIDGPKTKLKTTTSSPDKKELSLLIGGSVGGSLILLLCLVIGVVWFCRRFLKRRYTKNDPPRLNFDQYIKEMPPPSKHHGFLRKISADATYITPNHLEKPDCSSSWPSNQSNVVEVGSEWNLKLKPSVPSGRDAEENLTNYENEETERRNSNVSDDVYIHFQNSAEDQIEDPDACHDTRCNDTRYVTLIDINNSSLSLDHTPVMMCERDTV